MKYAISFLFLSFCIQTAFFARTHSVNDNQLVTQLKVVENDSTFWYMYVYDAGKKVMETKSYQVDSTTWIRKSLTEWVYDGDNCISQRERIWRGNYWDFTFSIDYSYSNGVLQNETQNVFSNGIASAIRKTDFSYNLNKLSTRKEYLKSQDGWHLTTQTDLRYKTGGTKADSLIISSYQADTLTSQSVSTFKYTNDLLVSQLTQQYTKVGLVNSDSINWFYYPNSTLLKTQKNKKWNTVILKWENFQRVDYEYNDSSQIMSETYQHWETMFWKNDLRYDYLYDSNNVMQKKMLSMPIYEDWRNTVSINYSDIIANNANTIRSTYEFWGGSTGDLTTSFIPFVFNNELVIRRAKSIQLSYAQYNDTILQNLLPQINSIGVYPNPSNGIFYITTHDSTLKSWAITDLNGRILKQNENSFQSSVVDITELSIGIYILKVSTDNSTNISKIIKR